MNKFVALPLIAAGTLSLAACNKPAENAAAPVDSTANMTADNAMGAGNAMAENAMANSSATADNSMNAANATSENAADGNAADPHGTSSGH